MDARTENVKNKFDPDPDQMKEDLNVEPAESREREGREKNFPS